MKKGTLAWVIPLVEKSLDFSTPERNGFCRRWLACVTSSNTADGSKTEIGAAAIVAQTSGFTLQDLIKSRPEVSRT
ncbi:MAG: hypothetical protein L0226_03875 [Acidobacteria bacterium]|nr:hypothetical protein [Acidobacteriota bacterium]MCI0663996.1 hypothetical protein [Acidobacteriota bacterium]